MKGTNWSVLEFQIQMILAPLFGGGPIPGGLIGKSEYQVIK